MSLGPRVARSVAALMLAAACAPAALTVPTTSPTATASDARATTSSPTSAPPVTPSSASPLARATPFGSLATTPAASPTPLVTAAAPIPGAALATSAPPIVTVVPTAVPPASPARTTTATATAEVVARGLDTAWALAFAPDGRLFVTERPGRVRVVRNGTLLVEPWATLPVSEKDGAERGLMGIAIDPDFARNGYVYLAYTYNAGGRDMNRLVRMRDANGRGIEETILIDGAGGGDNHDGGRVKIGPDGKLWWALGEAGGPQNVAQLPDRINGKILRLERDGSVPADNPTRGSYVWSMGHRNPQGLAWHPDTGALYASEHGPSMNGTSFCCHDEINVIVPGGNYGWPAVWGKAGDPRYIDPVHESGATETWAPGGAAFASTGPYRGSLFVATLRGSHLHRIVFATDGRTVVAEQRLLETYGRLRDVIEGPDGALYVTTSNRDGRAFPRPDDDRILRVTLR